jgi:hypothetical protein
LTITVKPLRFLEEHKMTDNRKSSTDVYWSLVWSDMESQVGKLVCPNDSLGQCCQNSNLQARHGHSTFVEPKLGRILTSNHAAPQQEHLPTADIQPALTVVHP